MELGKEKHRQVQFKINFLIIILTWHKPLSSTYITKTKLLVRHLAAMVQGKMYKGNKWSCCWRLEAINSVNYYVTKNPFHLKTITRGTLD